MRAVEEHPKYEEKRKNKKNMRAIEEHPEHEEKRKNKKKQLRIQFNKKNEKCLIVLHYKNAVEILLF